MDCGGACFREYPPGALFRAARQSAIESSEQAAENVFYRFRVPENGYRLFRVIHDFDPDTLDRGGILFGCGGRLARGFQLQTALASGGIGVSLNQSLVLEKRSFSTIQPE